MVVEGGDRRREGKDTKHRHPPSSREDDDDDDDDDDDEDDDDTGELEEAPSKFKLSGDDTGSGIDYNVLDEESWQRLEVYCKVTYSDISEMSSSTIHYCCYYKQHYTNTTTVPYFVLEYVTSCLLAKAVSRKVNVSRDSFRLASALRTPRVYHLEVGPTFARDACSVPVVPATVLLPHTAYCCSTVLRDKVSHNTACMSTCLHTKVTSMCSEIHPTLGY